MPSCCVPNCKNSAAKGFLMKHFPRNVERRAQWAANIPRENWAPTDFSCICEIHFSPDMWEKPRSDGKRILKCHAIPNIFEPWLQTVVASRQKLTQSVQTVEMDENSCLISNNSTQDQEEQIETLVAVTENQSNLSLSNRDDKIVWKKKYEKFKNLFKKRENRYGALLRKYNRLNILLKRLNIEKQNQHKQYAVNTKLYSIITKVFTNDQIEALTKKSTRGSKWSEDTVKKAIRLRIACGASGYKELLNQYIPLPSLRTLQENLETFHFEQGICEGVLNILKEKVNGFEDDRDKDAIIALDEMSIKSGTQFDPSTRSLYGHNSFLNSKGEIEKASHALVIMLCGIRARWKQVVAFYFTPSGYDGSQLKPIILQLIQKIEAIGLYVHSITSDMGSINRAMWRAFGISVSRGSTIENSIPHPINENRKLFFLADGPHLLKNLKTCLINNKLFTIPEDIMYANNINFSYVKVDHLKELLEIQENIAFKLTRKVKIDDLKNGRFSKMKVNKAKQILSTEISSSLKFIRKIRKSI